MVTSLVSVDCLCPCQFGWSTTVPDGTLSGKTCYCPKTSSASMGVRKVGISVTSRERFESKLAGRFYYM